MDRVRPCCFSGEVTLASLNPSLPCLLATLVHYNLPFCFRGSFFSHKVYDATQHTAALVQVRHANWCRERNEKVMGKKKFGKFGGQLGYQRKCIMQQKIIMYIVL